MFITESEQQQALKYFLATEGKLRVYTEIYSLGMKWPLRMLEGNGGERARSDF